MFDENELERRYLAFLRSEEDSAKEHEIAMDIAVDADDAIAEIRRLRAEVAGLRADAAARAALPLGASLRKMLDDVVVSENARASALTKAQRLSDAGDRRDWDACDAIEAEGPEVGDV